MEVRLESGFFSRLFDMTFTEFITIRIISILYGIAILGCGVATVGFLIAGFAGGAGRGLLSLILSPVVFLLSVIAARVWCEMLIAMIRTAENTGKLVVHENETAGAPGAR